LSNAPLALGPVGVASGSSAHRGSMLLTLAALALWRSGPVATLSTAYREGASAASSLIAFLLEGKDEHEHDHGEIPRNLFPTMNNLVYLESN